MAAVKLGGLQKNAKPDNQLTIKLLHENEVSQVHMSLNENVPTVEDFAKLVAETTSIPIENQRLIYKGKSLTDFAASLESYGIKSGSKVMVLGTKPTTEEDAEKTRVMNNVDDHVTATSHKLDDIAKQYSDIARGFLAGELQSEALTKLNRQLGCCIEDFTKDLERLDSLSLAQSIDGIKARRKKIVIKIQGLLKEADSLHNNITDLQKSKSEKSHSK